MMKNIKYFMRPRRGRGVCSGNEVICICPNCGYEIKKEPGKPCRDYTCPKCGTRMVRKD